MSRSSLLATVTLVLVSTTGATAQQPQGGQGARPPGPPQEAPTTELVFEREVFSYPRFERRNPFISLAGTGSGPRFESMSLVGVVYSPADPSQSIAMLRAGGSGEGATAMSARLRPGQEWGNIRILEIRRNEVLVEVEEFGLTEQQIMQLPTRRQGGS